MARLRGLPGAGSPGPHTGSFLSTARVPITQPGTETSRGGCAEGVGPVMPVVLPVTASTGHALQLLQKERSLG